MALFEIIILAIIQGLTEFLPISSSAHLILPSAVLGWQNQGLAFDVAVHVGSLFAVMTYFREDISNLCYHFIKRGFSNQQNQHSRLAWMIAIATVPGIIFGYLMKDWIALNARSALVIAMTTIIFGLLLWYADKRATLHKAIENIGPKEALIIGLSQAIAIIPGTSRSGITITSALMCGLDKVSAARFSFLLSIPIIMGAGLFSLKDLFEQESPIDANALVLGALFSYAAAYLCIKLFLGLINKMGMTPFVIYRLFLGVLLLCFVIWQS